MSYEALAAQANPHQDTEYGGKHLDTATDLYCNTNLY